jgi:hypothetical protein
MFRMKALWLLLAALFIARVPSASATVTYLVGSCHVGRSIFGTISEALAHTPAPDVVDVCPGTYPEQIVITKPVTLEGIANGEHGAVFITVPPGGLIPNADDGGAAAQVFVNNVPGEVNISNIVVDGSGNKVASGITLVGVLYENSSGTINHIETRFQQAVEGPEPGVDGSYGVSIDATSPETVTVKNSNMHSFSGTGIGANDNSAGNNVLTLNIEGNTVAADPGTLGILIYSGLFLNLTGNTITGPARDGMDIVLPVTGTVSKNSISGFGGNGIYLLTYGTGFTLSVTSNTIFDIGGDAIQLEEGVTVPIEGNTIMQSHYGIDFECNVDNNVNSNTFTAIHFEALENVPKSVVSSNSYFDVPTIRSVGVYCE